MRIVTVMQQAFPGRGLAAVSPDLAGGHKMLEGLGLGALGFQPPRRSRQGGQFDERTLENIDALKEVFGATSTAAAIRKALALASLAAKQATPERTIVIGGTEPTITVSLAT
jgi:hypothetical protein